MSRNLEILPSCYKLSPQLILRATCLTVPRSVYTKYVIHITKSTEVNFHACKVMKSSDILSAMFVYGKKFSRWIFCQKLVTFSSTLSINYSKFVNGMVKTKIFSEISLKRRVIIFDSIYLDLAICLSICLSIFFVTEAHKVILVSLHCKKIR